MNEELPATPQQEEADGIGRIALTSDGALLHRYLRRVLESCRATPDSGALQRHEGARILARDLMGLMAKEIEARRDGTSGTDQPLLTGRGPVAVGTGRTSRRVSPDAEPGTGGSGTT